MERLESLAASLRDRMVGFARELVRVPSPTGQEGELARLVADHMLQLGYDRVFTDRAGNVVGVMRGTGKGPHVLFNCHLDQVPPGSRENWPYDPYGGEVAEGWLWGRGASDVKGAMAAQMYAGALVKQAGTPLPGDLIVTMVVEEEPGDMWGMRHLCADVLASYPGKIGLCVLGEATGLDIFLGHRGRIEFEITTYGKMAHSSAPWAGDNAVYRMAPVIAEIEQMDRRMKTDPELGRASVSIIQVRCEPGEGCVVPDRCVVHVDRRFIPAEDVDGITREMAEAVAGALAAAVPDAVPGAMRDAVADAVAGAVPGAVPATVRVRQLHHRGYTGLEEDVPLVKEPFLTPRDHPVVKRVVELLSHVGQAPRFGTWFFGTDGGWVFKTMGIPVIGYSPGEEAYTHTYQDRVSLDLMYKSLLGYAAIATGTWQKESE